MNLSFCALASGSSGNSYIIRSESTGILVDAGISCKQILNSLGDMGIGQNDVMGILVTHEHVDHVKGLKVLTGKRPEWTVYLNHGMEKVLKGQIRTDNTVEINQNVEFTVGDIAVRPFQVSHDAVAPLGYSFICRNKEITIVTDTGYVTREAQQELDRSDLIVLEANHDVNMLKIGKYPWSLKQRILGDQGHLSNDAAAEALVKALQKDGKYRDIVLAHLSNENNFPQLAYQTVKNVLEENGYYVGKHINLWVAEKDEPSHYIEI